MNIEKIQTKLQSMFELSTQIGENRRIVFWNDPKHQYIELIDNNELILDNVKIHKLTENNNFYTKYLLEEEDIESNYLIYTNILDLTDKSNWLIDIVLYSQIFFADKLSIDLDELKIPSHLRSIAEQYEKFFKNNKRISKLSKLDISEFTEENLELGMIASLSNSKTIEMDDIFRTIIIESIDEEGYLIEDDDNKYYKEINNILGDSILKKYASKNYGYSYEEFSIKKLIITIVITALSKDISKEYLYNFESYITNQYLNCHLFIDKWMNDTRTRQNYNQLINVIENDLNLQSIFDNVEIEEIKDIEIAPCIDKKIILYIINSINNNIRQYNNYITTIKDRRTTHFYSEYQYTYESLLNLINMYKLESDHLYGILKEDPKKMFDTYKEDYSQMDMYYRKFYVAHDKEINNDIPKKLAIKVEEIYNNFINDLNSKWTSSIESNMEGKWIIPGVRNQKDFYRNYVYPSVSIGDRVFVIISDALRYEVGKELCDKLNEEVVGSTQIDAMLSVIPSITKTGMAALLPHEEINIRNNIDVYDKNQSTSGIENRKNIIQNSVKSSIAVDFDTLISLTRDDRKEMLKGYKLVYIYHNKIDAFGDKAATENQAFDAVEDTINDIQRIVRIIRNDLGGTNVLVTSDHGFIYQRSKLEESDKISKTKNYALEIGRRYMISDKNDDIEGTVKFNMEYLLDNNNYNVYMPNSIMRFKTQGGGSNFVHGGSSLQEVVVPIVQFKNIRKTSKRSVQVEKVKVHPIITSNKITNTPFKVRLYQTEKISSTNKEANYNIYLIDDKNEILSDVHSIIADKTSDNPSEREFSIVLNIPRSIKYDKNKSYYLVVKDKDDEVIISRESFTISLGIMSDIDFF